LAARSRLALCRLTRTRSSSSVDGGGPAGITVLVLSVPRSPPPPGSNWGNGADASQRIRNEGHGSGTGGADGDIPQRDPASGNRTLAVQFLGGGGGGGESVPVGGVGAETQRLAGPGTRPQSHASPSSVAYSASYVKKYASQQSPAAACSPGTRGCGGARRCRTLESGYIVVTIGHFFSAALTQRHHQRSLVMKNTVMW